MDVECPSCGARFAAPATAKTLTCPYCGLIFGERGEEDHYYFPVIKEEPYRILLNFLRRQFGIPADIAASSNLTRRDLHYIPIYFFYLYGFAEAGCGRARLTRAKEGVYRGIIAASMFEELLRDYPFPVRGKRFFKSDIMRVGIYHEPEFGKDEAYRRAEDVLQRMVMHELKKQCRRPRDVRWKESRIEYRGLIHYPIYHLEYIYDDQRYSAYIDGSDGKVIVAEHPVKLEARVMQLAVSGGLLIMAFMAGLPLSYIVGSPLPAIFSLVAASASSIPLLKRTFSLKVKASELKKIKEGHDSFTSYLRKLPI